MQLSGNLNIVCHCLSLGWASLVAQLVKNLLQCRRPGFDSRIGKRKATPGEFYGLYSQRGRKESDMTE